VLCQTDITGLYLQKKETRVNKVVDALLLKQSSGELVHQPAWAVGPGRRY
jgi:hypothetical protein